MEEKTIEDLTSLTTSIEEINKKLRNILTKEDKTFIQEVLEDTLKQMKDKLLGSIINRVESIECEIHDKAIENADLKQEIDTILGQSECLKNENKMLKLQLDKERFLRE